MIRPRALQRAIDDAAKAKVAACVAARRVSDARAETARQCAADRRPRRDAAGIRRRPLAVRQRWAPPMSRSPGLTLDGSAIGLPARRGLLHCERSRELRIVDCEFINSGGAGDLVRAGVGRGARQHLPQSCPPRRSCHSTPRACWSRRTRSPAPATTASKSSATRPATTARW